METQTSKRKPRCFEALFVRKTIQSNLLEGIIEIPSPLKNRLVELIVLPFDSEKDDKQSTKREDPALRRFAGAWAGEPLVRADQGQYEIREELS